MKDDPGTLPAGPTGHLLTMPAMSAPGAVRPGVPLAVAVLDAADLAEFGWGLFQRWQNAGAPAKEKWALDALGLVGDDETVRRLTPVIRAWPGERGHRKAVAGLDVPASIGTGVALMHLHGIAQRVTFKGLKDRAVDRIAEVADAMG